MIFRIYYHRIFCIPLPFINNNYIRRKYYVRGRKQVPLSLNNTWVTLHRFDNFRIIRLDIVARDMYSYVCIDNACNIPISLQC